MRHKNKLRATKHIHPEAQHIKKKQHTTDHVIANYSKFRAYMELEKTAGKSGMWTGHCWVVQA